MDYELRASDKMYVPNKGVRWLKKDTIVLKCVI